MVQTNKYKTKGPPKDRKGIVVIESSNNTEVAFMGCLLDCVLAFHIICENIELELYPSSEITRIELMVNIPKFQKYVTKYTVFLIEKIKRKEKEIQKKIFFNKVNNGYLKDLKERKRRFKLKSTMRAIRLDQINRQWPKAPKYKKPQNKRKKLLH